jgi:hypothetical protein
MPSFNEAFFNNCSGLLKRSSSRMLQTIMRKAQSGIGFSLLGCDIGYLSWDVFRFHGIILAQLGKTKDNRDLLYYA